MTPEAARDALRSWTSLNSVLHALSEEECWALLRAERGAARRPQVLLRVYGRANRLRTQRERRDLLEEAKT